MKVTIKREDLLSAVSTVHNIVSPQSTLRILQNILLETTSKGLLFIANDMEVGAKREVPAEIKEEGTITVQAKKFNDVVRELPTDVDISIETDGNLVKVDAGKLKYNLTGLSREDFPEFPTFLPQNSLFIDTKILKKLISKTSFAVSMDISRRILMGIYFQIKENKLVFVATDGKRLAYIDNEIDISKITPPVDIIIPSKALTELNKVLTEEGQVKIEIGQSLVLFEFNSTVFIARIIDGQYPDYTIVIPKEFKNTLIAESENLLRGIKAASVLSDVKTNAITFELKEKKIVLKTEHPELGSASTVIEAEYKGQPLQIAFNHNFITEIVRAINSEKVKISLNEALSPSMFTSIDETDTSKYILMPLKIADI